jgi:hypothetical protein
LGPDALTPEVEIVWTGCQSPFAVRFEDWILKWEPSERVQTAITVPLGATATSGSNPSWPAAEMGIADRKVGVAWAVAGPSRAAPSTTKKRSCQRCALRKMLTTTPSREKETPARLARS